MVALEKCQTLSGSRSSHSSISKRLEVTCYKQQITCKIFTSTITEI